MQKFFKDKHFSIMCIQDVTLRHNKDIRVPRKNLRGTRMSGTCPGPTKRDRTERRYSDRSRILTLRNLIPAPWPRKPTWPFSLNIPGWFLWSAVYGL